MTQRNVILSTFAALTLCAAMVQVLDARNPRRSVDQITVVIRSEGLNFVLDSYYEGQVRTTKPLAPRDLVPYLTSQVQPGARIIDLTGKVHVVQW